MSSNGQPKLDSLEQHFTIPGPRAGASLFLRCLPTAETSFTPRRAVLYVHGATFPSGLSIAHRLSGRSWRDDLCAAGFDVWGLDFYGFGGSDRYPEMDEDAAAHAPLCAAVDAEGQLEVAARFILSHQGLDRLSLISHSWGSMPAGRFAGAHPGLLDRWVLFAPIAMRQAPSGEAMSGFPAWRLISLEDQWNRFVEDVPPGEAPVLSKAEFDDWGESYLESDPGARERDPPAVRTPLGPYSEIVRAWHGQLAWDPSLVSCPIAIVRGEWDSLVTDADARRLYDAFSRSPVKRDIKIGRATHLMHLETMRWALWRESADFLTGADVALDLTPTRRPDHVFGNLRGQPQARPHRRISPGGETPDADPAQDRRLHRQ
jgi:pimeloyl-ACP methyl ester carboxylesterase